MHINDRPRPSTPADSTIHVHLCTMCLEHKQYWQCCLTIDSQYVDPCPDVEAGFRCQPIERVHPIGGHCPRCRVTMDKLEDDPVAKPMYSQNDGYGRPWESNSRALMTSMFGRQRSMSPSAQTERGRRTRRLGDSSKPIDRRDYSYFYTERPRTPPPPLLSYSSSSDDDYQYRLRHKSKHASKHARKHQEKSYAANVPSTQYRVASPATIKRLQLSGLVAPDKCRIVSSHKELRELQRQGIVPPTEVLQRLQLQHGCRI